MIIKISINKFWKYYYIKSWLKFVPYYSDDSQNHNSEKLRFHSKETNVQDNQIEMQAKMVIIKYEKGMRR